MYRHHLKADDSQIFPWASYPFTSAWNSRVTAHACLSSSPSTSLAPCFVASLQSIFLSSPQGPEQKGRGVISDSSSLSDHIWYSFLISLETLISLSLCCLLGVPSQGHPPRCSEIASQANLSLCPCLARWDANGCISFPHPLPTVCKGRKRSCLCAVQRLWLKVSPLWLLSPASSTLPDMSAFLVLCAHTQKHHLKCSACCFFKLTLLGYSVPEKLQR